ncbi:ribbon-helix-helix protein, CopG family [Microcoleus sp. Pol11C1]|uniref:ribbon-helix-helix protein, CopG family n=1 Tax=unclassified Microcoleus TaxID=2642155 RepID=UPI002FCEE9CF
MKKPKKKQNSERPKYSIKQAHPGQQCLRNVPILYDEKKQPISLTLTPTAIKKLAELALMVEDSRSQVIEQLLRNITPTQAKKIIDKKTE